MWVWVNRKFLLAASQWSHCSGSQCRPEPFSGWAFKHKNHCLGWHTSDARTLSQKQNHRKQKPRLGHLKTFPNYGLSCIRSLFLFWRVVLSVCSVSGLERYFHHGVSCVQFWVPVTKGSLLTGLLSRTCSTTILRPTYLGMALPAYKWHHQKWAGSS